MIYFRMDMQIIAIKRLVYGCHILSVSKAVHKCRGNVSGTRNEMNFTHEDNRNRLDPDALPDAKIPP